MWFAPLLLLLAACSSNTTRHTSSWFGADNKKFEVSPEGYDRPSKLFIPTNYDTQDKWPLILSLHGYTSNANQADVLLGLSKRVTSRGFLLLTPEGTKLPYDFKDEKNHWKKGDQFWNATDFCCDFEKTNVDDVGYLLALIKETSAKYHVDPERIYIFGHSNGGFMANRLLCETDRFFAGVATLAGSTFKDPAKCRLQNPVSYLQVHAEDDPTVSFGDNAYHAGGYGTVRQRLKAAQCADPATIGKEENYARSIPGTDTTPFTWSKCAEGTEVSLWRVRPYKGWHAPHHPWFLNEAGEAAIDFLFKHKRAVKTE